MSTLVNKNIDKLAFIDVWNQDKNVIESFEIPKSAKIKRCFDWGFVKPFAVIYIWETNGEEILLSNGSKKVFQKGTIIVVGELYGCGEQVDQGCKKTAIEVGKTIKEYEASLNWNSQIVAGPSDSSIWNGLDVDDNIYKDIQFGFGTDDILFTPAKKDCGSRSRSFLLMEAMMSSDNPKLLLFDSCKHSIRTIPLLKLDQNFISDIDTKSEDHLYDTIRCALLEVA